MLPNTTDHPRDEPITLGPAHAAAPIVTMRDITVEFPGVRALDAVSFRLFPGEVHALLGENGAGKSTLIKALTGVYRATSGEIVIGGERLDISGPADAQRAGIRTVYQEVPMAANLSVAENIMLGREPRRFGRISFGRMRQQASAVLEQLHIDVDPGSPLETHSIAVQQLVAIARAVGVGSRVLVLDEPTSSLDANEVAELFRLVRHVRAAGVAVLFVTHFLEQVYEIADRITVLRNGRFVAERPTADLPRLELVSLMIGRELDTLEQLERDTQRSVDDGASAPPFLTAAALGRRAAISPFDLTVRRGEVVGMAGLLGSGRTEAARLLAGADRADAGVLTVDGAEVRLRTPRVALGHGIAFASENRRTEGLVGDLSVRSNIVLAMQSARGWARAIPRRLQDSLAERFIKALDIRPTNPEAIVANLSGGNQQKVLLARWLLTEPKLLILDEPTRGIDVGAKAEIQKLVAGLAADGMAVLFISAELEEVVRLSHRIVVMRDREKVDDVDNDGTTVADLMRIIAKERSDSGGGERSDALGAVVAVPGLEEPA
jgi:simple sugar transport system ATP-binding protein